VPLSKKSLNSTDQTNLYYSAVFWRLAGYCLFSATKFQWRHCQVLAVDAFYTSGLINKRFFIALSICMRQGGLHHFCELSPTASSLPWFWGCTGTDVKNVLKTPLNFLTRKGQGELISPLSQTMETGLHQCTQTTAQSSEKVGFSSQSP